jgi:hypothetical protein
MLTSLCCIRCRSIWLLNTVAGFTVSVPGEAKTMFGSTMLDTAIGLLLLYLLLSLIASGIQELLEAKLKVRATNLESGLRELLQDKDGTGITSHIYNHPLIFGLYRGTYNPAKIRERLSTTLPTYIPAANFAAALMDIIVRGPVEVEGKCAAPTAEVTFESLRAAVAAGSFVGHGGVQRALLMALDSAQGDLSRAQTNIEAWFNSSMDRVSGWYKRYTQAVLLVIGATVVVLFNVDSVRVAKELYLNDALRAAAIAQAGALTEEQTVPQQSIDAATETLEKLQLPIGWSGDRSDWPLAFGLPAKEQEQPGLADLGALLGHVLGWIITAIAISFGAPFWFDLLNKLMVIRSTVKPHEKSPEESSEDRQRPEGGVKQWRVGQQSGSPPASPRAPASTGGNDGTPFQPHEWEGDADPDGGKL